MLATAPASSERWLPTLEATRVALCPVEPNTFAALYDIASDPDTALRWRTRGLIPTREEFMQALRTDCFTQFAVVGRASTTVLGHAIAYDADFRHARCAIGLALCDEAVGRGLGIEAGILFVSYLFQTWPFNKLFLEIPAFNLAQIRHLADAHLVREAIVERHHYFDHQYHDLHVYSIKREAWATLNPEIAMNTPSRSEHAS